MDRRPLRPLNALLHPAWLAALALLIFNDHYLKASELMPALSGKLSDFAGLLVAPVLLAVLLRVKTRRGLWLSAAAVGAVFSAINLSPSIATTWDAMVSTLMPYRTTVDPTDLVALVMLPLAVMMFVPVMAAELNRSRARRTAQVSLAAFGILMCTATSEDESCTTNSDCYEGDICVDEWCETPPTLCNSDADCPDSFLECAAGECSYRPNCQQDSQCPSGTCEPDGRCDLAGTPIGGSNANLSMTMMDDVEAQSMDERSVLEFETRPLQSLDPALLDYLHDPASPVVR